MVLHFMNSYSEHATDWKKTSIFTTETSQVAALLAGTLLKFKNTIDYSLLIFTMNKAAKKMNMLLWL